jgi:hypothetical protein
LSRFLPDAEVEKINKDYTKELAGYLKENPWFLAFVGRYSLTPEQFEAYKKFNPKEAETKLTPVKDDQGNIVKYNIKFDKDNYRYIMLDEFIAEKMTDLVLGKQQEPNTFLGKLAKVLREFMALIKARLGIDAYEKFYQAVTSTNGKLTLQRQSGVAPAMQIYEPVEYDYSTRRMELQTQDARFAELEARAKAGDKEAEAEAQRMVDEAAKASGLPILDDSASEAYRARRTPPPQKTIKGYKLFTTKPNRQGELFPLFVGSNESVPQGVWLDAIEGRAAAPSKTGKPQVKSKLGPLAFRPGWHAGDLPLATHIGIKNAEGKVSARRANEVWAEVELANDTDYQPEADASKTRDLRSMPKDGAYRFKTNPNMTGNWIISGSMKVNRIMSQQEVDSILEQNNVTPMPWEGGVLDLQRMGLSTEKAVNTLKLSDPFTYDDAGNLIPLSERFQPTSPDIRMMAVEAEPRREQVAGRTDRGTDIITTPVGIIKQTNEVLRKNFFDGTTVSDEATKNAWLYISRSLDIESGVASELAGEINNVVDAATNSKARMGASLFHASLANYAAKLAALGDDTMLSFLVRRINRMPLDNKPGDLSQYARGLRGAREYDIDGYGALKVEQQAKRDRTAAEIFARGNPTEQQVKAVSDAIDAADNATIGTPDEVASDVEKIEKRTKRNITKKLETLLKKGSLKEMIASIKNTPLEEQQTPLSKQGLLEMPLRLPLNYTTAFCPRDSLQRNKRHLKKP